MRSIFGDASNRDGDDCIIAVKLSPLRRIPCVSFGYLIKTRTGSGSSMVKRLPVVTSDIAHLRPVLRYWRAHSDRLFSSLCRNLEEGELFV